MSVLVDTSVWSLALRRMRRTRPPVEATLQSLIEQRNVRVIGPIRQELLSGIRDARQFETLKRYLAAFPDEEIETGDYERAAQFYNRCRARGVQGSNTDFLICAVAARCEWSIFSTDRDFRLFERHLPIALYGT